MNDAISRNAVLDIIDKERRFLESLRETICDNEDRAHNTGELGCAIRLARKIKDLPSLDAAPVVRCKDCVHSAKLEGYHQRRLENGLNCNACRGENGYGIAKLSLTTPDGYCDYGLRRSSDANE